MPLVLAMALLRPHVAIKGLLPKGVDRLDLILESVSSIELGQMPMIGSWGYKRILRASINRDAITEVVQLVHMRFSQVDDRLFNIKRASLLI